MYTPHQRRSQSRFCARWCLKGLRGVFMSLLPSVCGAFQERSSLSRIQEPLGIQKAEKLDGLGDAPGPPGLMACTKAGTVVTVEVLVEEYFHGDNGAGLG